MTVNNCHTYNTIRQVVHSAADFAMDMPIQWKLNILDYVTCWLDTVTFLWLNSNKWW